MKWNHKVFNKSIGSRQQRDEKNQRGGNGREIYLLNWLFILPENFFRFCGISFGIWFDVQNRFVRWLLWEWKLMEIDEISPYLAAPWFTSRNASSLQRIRLVQPTFPRTKRYLPHVRAPVPRSISVQHRWIVGSIGNWMSAEAVATADCSINRMGDHTNKISISTCSALSSG